MKENRAGEKLYKVFIYVVLIALAVCILVPVAWVFMASIKENSEFYGNPWSLPLGFHWQNFVDAWNTAKMGDYMLNSVIVTAGPGHPAGGGPACGLLPVPVPLPGPQVPEHRLYGRPVHQRQLHRGAHLLDAA